MTKDEAVKHVRAYVKRKYRRQKVMAYERGIEPGSISSAIRSLASWIVEEAGLTKKVEVSYDLKEGA